MSKKKKKKTPTNNLPINKNNRIGTPEAKGLRGMKGTRNRNGILTGKRILGGSRHVPRILILKNLNTNLTKNNNFMNKESMTRARASDRIHHPTNNNKNIMEEGEEKDTKKDLSLALEGSHMLGGGVRSRSRSS